VRRAVETLAAALAWLEPPPGAFAILATLAATRALYLVLTSP
jgi:hypothetical protein